MRYFLVFNIESLLAYFWNDQDFDVAVRGFVTDDVHVRINFPHVISSVPC